MFKQIFAALALAVICTSTATNITASAMRPEYGFVDPVGPTVTITVKELKRTFTIVDSSMDKKAVAKALNLKISKVFKCRSTPTCDNLVQSKELWNKIKYDWSANTGSGIISVENLQ